MKHDVKKLLHEERNLTWKWNFLKKRLNSYIYIYRRCKERESCYLSYVTRKPHNSVRLFFKRILSILPLYVHINRVEKINFRRKKKSLPDFNPNYLKFHPLSNEPTNQTLSIFAPQRSNLRNVATERGGRSVSVSYLPPTFVPLPISPAGSSSTAFPPRDVTTKSREPPARKGWTTRLERGVRKSCAKACKRWHSGTRDYLAERIRGGNSEWGGEGEGNGWPKKKGPRAICLVVYNRL